MEKRAFKTDDFYNLKSPESAQISQDGNYIAYAIKEIDKEEDKYISNIFLWDVKNQRSRQITFSGKDNFPVFSPDGKRLAFVSDRNKKSQIWLLSLYGGEAWCLKTREAVSGSLVWTPDGNNIIYCAEVFSHNKEEWTPYNGAPEYDRDRLIKLAEKAHKDNDKDEDDKKENMVKVITRFHYREDGYGYLGDVRNQVFITPVPEFPSSNWKPQGRQITEGDYNHNTPSISPDGKYITVSSSHSQYADYEEKQDLWLIELETGKLHLLYDAPGPSYRPTWSPCGGYIAFTGHDNKIGLSTTLHLWILNVKEYMEKLKTNNQTEPLNISNAVNITGLLDRPIYGGHNKGFTNDKLFFLVNDRGSGSVYEFNYSNQIKPVLVDRNKDITSLVVSKNYFVYTASNPVYPQELYLFDGEEKRLTDANKELMDYIEVGNWEEANYKSKDGQSLDSWVIYPNNFNSDKKYPLVLLVHGGPHGFYGPNFMFQTQVFTSRGYVVLYTNPRGSEAYGQQFACCIDKNWGDKDYSDIMSGVDALIEKGFIDINKMFVHGWSYGGYMACWIATQTDRFKAICAGASVTNMLSGYGTSDITLADEYEYGGQPWKDYEHLIKHSAIGHVENVKTPMMLMHGDNDLRVRATQTEEFYIALKRLRKEVIMIRYPNEFHGLSRPVHAVDRFDRLAAWFDYYRNQP